ncbi:hypothetical protein AMTR_s00015p00251860 [Amborella trichopoda]|uniref:Uncharacterized protein n=1 Tax=Amborella trichopoda TaxID=13333 RepID=W1PLL3_AMBTC|nr:hypothetical protein AMTR_s00015p00251860 [Amborella trichopoda]
MDSSSPAPSSDVTRFPDVERSTQLKALEANYARVKCEMFGQNSCLASSNTARVSELMTLTMAINAFILEYDEKCAELNEWSQEYLADLVALRDLEGCMAKVRRLIGYEDPVVVDVEGCERTTSHHSQDQRSFSEEAFTFFDMFSSSLRRIHQPSFVFLRR